MPVSIRHILLMSLIAMVVAPIEGRAETKKSKAFDVSLAEVDVPARPFQSPDSWVALESKRLTVKVGRSPAVSLELTPEWFLRKDIQRQLRILLRSLPRTASSVNVVVDGDVSNSMVQELLRLFSNLGMPAASMIVRGPGGTLGQLPFRTGWKVPDSNRDDIQLTWGRMARSVVRRWPKLRQKSYARWLRNNRRRLARKPGVDLVRRQIRKVNGGVLTGAAPLGPKVTCPYLPFDSNGAVTRARLRAATETICAKGARFVEVNAPRQVAWRDMAPLIAFVIMTPKCQVRAYYPRHTGDCVCPYSAQR